MGEKVPYRIYLREEVIEALKEAAERTDEMSHNEIASEIITRFLPHWIRAREAFDAEIEGPDSEAKTRRKPR